MKPLSLKQEKFVRAYIKSGNASQSYIDAGYSKKGANRAGPRLLANVGIAAAIDSRRAALELAQDAETVAGIREIEERLTSQLRGKPYEADLAVLQERVDSKLASIDALRASLAKVDDPMMKAALHGKILDSEGEILRDMIQLKQLRLSQQAESNKAAVTLAKMKGAFDPRRPAVDDPTALLNSLVRNILRSGHSPKALLNQIMSGAQDAVFSIRSSEPEPDPEPGPGRGEEPRRPGLFVRGVPGPKDS